MWFSKLLRPKKQKIQVSVEVTPQVITSSLHSRLKKALEVCDIDELVKNPVASMAILTLYNHNTSDLLLEVVSPSKSRSLAGVTLYSFFSDTHLAPSLVMERLVSIFKDTPVSNYAKHDIGVFIEDLYSLSRCKES